MPEKILRQHIEVALLGCGWGAVHAVEVLPPDRPPYWDVQSTSVGRYKTREEAMIEARIWSEADGIPLKAGEGVGPHMVKTRTRVTKEHSLDLDEAAIIAMLTSAGVTVPAHAVFDFDDRAVRILWVETETTIL